MIIPKSKIDRSNEEIDKLFTDFKPGDTVRHFKRELVDQNSDLYLYRILHFGKHTETGEKMVVYQALYGEKEIFIRPYDMFTSEVDHVKYPDIKQKYRLEKLYATDKEGNIYLNFNTEEE